jgi:hypothetical protein
MPTNQTSLECECVLQGADVIKSTISRHEDNISIQNRKRLNFAPPPQSDAELSDAFTLRRLHSREAQKCFIRSRLFHWLVVSLLSVGPLER